MNREFRIYQVRGIDLLTSYEQLVDMTLLVVGSDGCNIFQRRFINIFEICCFTETGNNWITNRDMIQQIDPDTGDKVSTSLPYLFDHVFDTSARTTEVYEAMVGPVVLDALNGFNGTILCYGQTSSGSYSFSLWFFNVFWR